MLSRRLILALLVLAGLSLPARAFEAGRPPWPDTALARLQAYALVQTLNAELLSNASATLTLDRWCAAHALAPAGAKVVAGRVREADKPADAAIRELLGAGPQERIVYRRVRLTCGARVLSEADNWYRPALLAEEMNRELETTDTAFGRVVRPLGFSRSTLAARLLWQPLPVGWEMGAPIPADPGRNLDMPEFLLEHRAVLKLPDGRAFSALVESYTRDILAFPPPP
ncbi:hypothetical protein [Ancylobacter defluvii]|uniref:Uncharacterized protein n=1 Tax=Ancylobacter defluvii TaxID=1282440 RepID=A0A9W6JYF1_9HYPH|nr:hypothetical protein [Ancylobacter defluvii]MBS7589008.1 hypothetical protein [Ancylobacter defluvii]GLK84614.1 hypothetical protein GCM10017653_26840 [Ancylobacter defluvii]